MLLLFGRKPHRPWGWRAG